MDRKTPWCPEPAPVISVHQLFGLLAWLLVTLLSGDLLVTGIQRNRQVDWPERWGLAFGMGVGIQATLYFWLSLLGLRMQFWLILLVSLPFLLGWLVLMRGRRAPKAAVEPDPPTPWPARGAFLMVFLFAALLLGQTASKPEHGWDTRSHWVFTAKLVHSDQSVRSLGLTDQDRFHVHRDYPMLVPLTVWSAFNWVGGPDDRAMRPIFPIFYLALLGVVWGAFGSATPPGWRHGCLLLLAGTPFLLLQIEGGAFSSHAEVPLALMMAGHVAALVAWMEEGRRPSLLLAALFAVFAIFTKREGIPLVGISLAAAALCSPGCAYRRWKPLLACAGILLVLSTPWLLHRASLSTTSSFLAPITGTAEKSGFEMFCLWGGQTLLVYLKQMFLGIEFWGLLWWAFAASILTGGLRGEQVECRRYLLLMVCVYFFVLLWVWGRHEPGRGNNVNSFSRTLVTLLTAVVLFVARGLRPQGHDGPSAEAAQPLPTVLDGEVIE